MAIDGMLVRGLRDEFRAVLTNARVSKIYQPDTFTLLVHLRQPGQNLMLLASADPQNPRIHLTDASLPNPEAPPTFCRVLRKHLEPGRIVSVDQPGLDRILVFAIESYDELGARVELRLIVELMGRHSNVILVDPSDTIIDGLRRIGETKSRHRHVVPGAPYIDPPEQDKIDPLGVEHETFLFAMRHVPGRQRLFKAVMEEYEGIGPLAAREWVYRAGLSPTATRDECGMPELERLWEVLHKLVRDLKGRAIRPTVVRNAADGSLDDVWVFDPTHLDGTRTAFEGLNKALDVYYTERIESVRRESLRSELLRPVQEERNKVQRRLEVKEKALAQAQDSDEYKLWGELLTAYLYRIEDGRDQVTLENYYNGEKVTIQLDRRFSPAENAQLYFNKYQKSKRATKALTGQIAATRSELAYLEDVATMIELARTGTDLEDIRDELRSQRYLAAGESGTKKNTRTTASGPYRFKSSDRTTILVGRNNRQNDVLTTKTAQPNDLWLHTKDIPGSHVIIRTENGTASEHTIEEAALLAAHFSKARHSSKVPVDVTEVRHVRKPNGARPGYVIYDHQRTLYVTVGEPLANRLNAIDPSRDGQCPFETVHSGT